MGVEDPSLYNDVQKMVALLLFLFFVATSAAGKAVVPILFKASDTRPGEHMVVADMVIGKPPRKLRLEVRFDIADVFLYDDQAVHSAKFLFHEATPYGSGGFDSVFFGSEERRAYVQSNTRGRTPSLAYPLLCSSCRGILGLRSDAHIWKWWPTASITTGSITFGERLPVVSQTDRGAVFSCERVALPEASVCSIKTVVDGTHFLASLNPVSPYMTLPTDIQESYLAGKNIYRHDKTAEWPALRVNLVSDPGYKNVSLGLTHEDLTGQHGNEARELLIRTGDNPDDMEIGSVLLWNYAMFVDKNTASVTLYPHAVHEHLPAGYVLLFLLGSGLLLRYKMVSSIRHHDQLPRNTGITIVNTVYEIIGWIIPVILLSLEETRHVFIPDYTTLYTVTASIVGIGIIVGIAARLRVGYAQQKGLDAITPSMYCIMFAEALAYETVLLTGIWLAVVPRRREGIASTLTAFVGACALYTMVSYLFYWTTYVFCKFGQTKRSKRRMQPAPPWFSGLISLAVLGLFAYFSVLFVVFFMTPLLARVGTIYADLALGTSLVVAAIIAIGGTYVASTQIRRAIGIHARTRLQEVS